MLEFLFGWIIGVWMGQQLPLPSVQTVLHNWWVPKPEPQTASTTVSDAMEEDHESSPLFTGDMPPATAV
jgi:hypothetical protein